MRVGRQNETPATPGVNSFLYTKVLAFAFKNAEKAWESWVNKVIVLKWKVPEVS